MLRADSWFNMTKAAQHFGKDVRDFMYAPSTKEYVDELSKCGKLLQLSEVRPGRYGGTWAHPKLAVFIARWLDVRFSVWCDAVIEDILRSPLRTAQAWAARCGRSSAPTRDCRLPPTLRKEPQPSSLQTLRLR